VCGTAVPWLPLSSLYEKSELCMTDQSLRAHFVAEPVVLPDGRKDGRWTHEKRSRPRSDEARP
jgi:hypothetical protein